jgi:hypothetical protein
LIHLSGEVDWRWCATRGSRRARWTARQQDGNIRDTTEVNTSTAETTRTDRDIQRMSHHLAQMEAAAADPLAPRPLRDRATARAARYQAIIGRHQASRPRAGDDQESEPR